MINYLIGIDPSFVTMGAAVYNMETRGLKLYTSDLNGVVSWINKNVDLKQSMFVVENPALNSNVFGMWPMVETPIKGLLNYEVSKAKHLPPPKHYTIEDVRSAFLIAMKRAQDVGENKAAAKYFLRLIYGKAPIYEVSPSQRDRYDKIRKKLGKGAKINLDSLKFPLKVPKTYFQEWTGFGKQCSEHARDAAGLVFNRTKSWAILAAKQSKKPDSYPSGANNNYFVVERKKS